MLITCISCSIVYLLYSLYLILFAKLFFTLSLLSLSSYVLYILFIFLKKTLYTSKSTASIYRFWKLSYYLFWLLEFILFFIYLYLFLNSTFELWFMLNINYMVFCSFNFSGVFVTLFIWLIVFFLLNIFVVNLVYNRSNVMVVILLAMFMIYFTITELFNFIYINNFFNVFLYNFEYAESVWVLEIDTLIAQPVFYYFYIFSLLKLWHLLFMFYYFFIHLGFTNLLNVKNQLTHTIGSFFFLKQNFYILFIFYLLNMLVLFKPYFLGLYQVIYGEMFIHVTQFTYMFINILLQLNYVF